MHLPHPINIDLLEFCKSGCFDFIKLGQSKAWILSNFPDPDNFTSDLLHARWPIWTYDRIEFHFDADNRLTAIYTDYLDELAHNTRLRVRPWIFAHVERLTLLAVLRELNAEGIDYEKKTSPQGVGLRLGSGLRLSFSPPDEPGVTMAEGPNEFRLTSLCLCD